VVVDDELRLAVEDVRELVERRINFVDEEMRAA